MTDFTAGTDLCFTKTNLTSAYCLLFCVCTLGLYPELASLQTMNTETSPLPSAAFIYFSVPAGGCTAQSPRL